MTADTARRERKAMKTKPITPYKRLLDEATMFAYALRCAHRVTIMDAGEMADDFDACEMEARVDTATKLGYVVELRLDKGGNLYAEARKLSDVPFTFCDEFNWKV